MHYRFESFEVDAARGRLLRDNEVIPLTGKAFEALLALVEARGEIVEKDALMRRLWPDTAVEEGNLAQQISTVRKALGESPGDHKYILTIARRGYRFVAPVATSRQSPVTPQRRLTVGRENETRALERAFENVASGRGMMVCVAGEAGIGKSTLVGEFVDGIADRALILGGRCSERLTSGEAHLPVLEALETLLRTQADPAITQLLMKRAPSWYGQIAPLVGAERNANATPMQASQERRKRELAVFLEELAAQSPVVLWLDDIHWADPSTLDLLVYLTTRCETTRLLLIGSYRAAELQLEQEPFVQSLRDLRTRSRAPEISLDFLTRDDVDQYLSLEFAGHAFPRDFSELLHRRTGGNPLFLTDLVRHLKERGDIFPDEGGWRVKLPVSEVARDLPASIRNLIDRTIVSLEPADRQILATAGVQGVEFDSAVVARATGMTPAEVEERLARMARVHNIIRRVSLQDVLEQTNERYAFVHVLHHEALYESLVPSRRVAVNSAVADALREMFAGQPQRIAHQLALLYEAGKRPLDAIDQFIVAAQMAVAVSASREAASLARRGLTLVATLPAQPEVFARELQLLITLGVPLASMAGYANPEVERTYTRALALCRELDAQDALFPVLWGLWVLYHVRADLTRALEYAKQALAFAEASEDRRLMAAANVFLGYTLGHMGKLKEALDHLRSAQSLFDPSYHEFYHRLTALDPLVASLAQQGRLLALMGETDVALEKARQAVDVARSLRTPNAIGFALVWQAYVHQLRGETEQVQAITGEALALATEHGLADVRGWAAVWFAWAGSDPAAGLAIMRQSLDAQRQFGSEIARPHQLALVAEVMARAGDVQGALRTVDEALEQAARTNDVYYEPELYRLQGEVLSRSGAPKEQGFCSFHRAVEIARRHGSRLFERKAMAELGGG